MLRTVLYLVFAASILPPTAVFAASEGLEFQLKDVRVQQPNRLDASFQVATIEADGKVHLGQGTFDFQRYTKPITGTVERVSGTVNDNFWQISGLTVFIDQARMIFHRGTFDTNASVLSGDSGVQLWTETADVQAQHGRLALQSGIGELTKHVQGTIRP